MSGERDDGLFHGRELDEAMKLAYVTPPPNMPLCTSALDSRTKGMVDQQLEELQSEEARTGVRKSLMDAGAPFDDAMVDAINLRSTIGGSFTLGIATGLALVGMLATPEHPGGEEGG